MSFRVPLADLDYGAEEEAAVLDVLRRRWLTMGAVTLDFEARFAERHQVEHAVAVSNCTAALHLACVALGIGPGDEVIVPSLTFIATANAVLHTGATVRFADIASPDDLGICPHSIAEQINERTKAVIVVHYAGYPCRMPEIVALAREHGLAVIEDAAHAPGASLDHVPMGGWGDAGCFSFFPNKNIAVGEGGMLTTGRDDVAERLRILRSHGMTTLTWDRHRGHAYSYDVIDLGYNARIDEIRSALGLAQLEKLDANNERRRRLDALYRQRLAGTEIRVPFADTPGVSSCHIFPVLLPPGVDRLAVVDEMRQAGVQTSIHYPPIHRFSYYRERFGDVSLPCTEDVAARELTLPLFPTMSEEMLDIVVTELRKAVESV